MKGLDLSSWRLAFNGAEPVNPNTIRHFYERFRAYGLKQEAMFPVYGLAECAVGLAFPPMGRLPLIDRIKREPFSKSGKAVPAAEGEKQALEFVACGQPLPGYQIRIVDETGRELPGRQEGRLQFRGPSATSGYFRNPVESRKLFDGEWLNSGDLAYISGGDIFLTGRNKDIIIRAGRNIHPYELEEAIGNVQGIRKGCVAVFGCFNEKAGTEKLVVLAETREKNEEALASLQTQINSLVSDLVGIAPDDIVLVPPHTVLKTSSGKIRRAASRDLYEQGDIGKLSGKLWVQIAKLIAAALPMQWRRLRRVINDAFYYLYAWCNFFFFAALVWTLVIILPAIAWRWAVMRWCARVLARTTGISINVEGLEHLPDKPFIVVSNHASYLDGLILVAALPQRFSFVAKAELLGKFISRVFIQRIGGEFVERFDMQRGIADARRIGKSARSGQSFCFFPEGTFTRMPGLLPFYTGAFVAAAEANIPIIPVVIRGSRSILRAESWFPRRGIVNVIVCGPLYPEGTGWGANGIHIIRK